MVQILLACAGAITRTAQPPWSLPREVSSPRAPTTSPAPTAPVATTTTHYNILQSYVTMTYDYRVNNIVSLTFFKWFLDILTSNTLAFAGSPLGPSLPKSLLHLETKLQLLSVRNIFGHTLDSLDFRPPGLSHTFTHKAKCAELNLLYFAHLTALLSRILGCYRLQGKHKPNLSAIAGGA